MKNILSLKIKTGLFMLALCLINMTGHAQSKPGKTSENTKTSVQFQNDDFKTQWIKQNPEAYNNMGGVISSDEQSQSLSRQSTNQHTPTKREIIIFPDIQSFPKFEQTGDPLVDNENYRMKKQAWINSHQEEYNKMNVVNNSDSKKRVKRVINE